MSKNKNISYSKYVHKFVDKYGVTRFAVAEFIDDNKYRRPSDLRTYKLTGCTYETGSLEYLGGYLTRKQALRRARYLFGGK